MLLKMGKSFLDGVPYFIFFINEIIPVKFIAFSLIRNSLSNYKGRGRPFNLFYLFVLKSQANTTVAVIAPKIWVAIKAGASIGDMPVKVLVRVRAIVTAGLANEVEAVNQYPAVINSPTA